MRPVNFDPVEPRLLSHQGASHESFSNVAQLFDGRRAPPWLAWSDEAGRAERRKLRMGSVAAFGPDRPFVPELHQHAAADGLHLPYAIHPGLEGVLRHPAEERILSGRGVIDPA